MGTVALTEDQLTAIVTIERVCSSLSLFGCAVIVVTFLSSRAFHKPINRLVFYASVGNIMTNIATLIGRSAIGNPTGSLCQVQGFLIQMFMCADAYWTLAMACNVYLTFFHKYDAEKIRTMEKWYFLACYGIPFIPALAYLFIVSSAGRHVYGDATIWCWVTKDFDVIRIATFYGPVWVAMAATFFIYIRAGKEIYNKRQQLLSFNRNDGAALTSFSEPFTTMKTTEVHVTSEIIYPIDLAELGRRPSSRPAGNGPQMYSVHVSSNQGEFAPPPRIAMPEEKTNSMSMPVSELPRFNRNLAMEANNAAWSYTKVAILFFTAMLVTWIPSSANRLYSVGTEGQILPALEFAAAFVLPLQGFWNAVIYMTTSWKACRKFFSTNPFRSPHSQIGSASFINRLPSRGKNSESESITELTNRPPTSGSHR